MKVEEIKNKVNNINVFKNNLIISDNKINKINTFIDNINKINNESIPIIRNTHVDVGDLFKEIGILDPLGLRYNPLTGEDYENIYYDTDNITYTSLSDKWSKFPMYAKREESIKAIYNNQVLLVVSGTGSGKTVLTPKFALHVLNYQGRIAITNPKRAPTKENALFAAKCMDVKLGTHIGMKFRNSEASAYSSDCKLIYVTDGWILQKLQNDPLLSDIDVVIIDEAHERGVNIDLLLLLLKNLLLIRPNFKLIIMSATINAKLFIDYFPADLFKFAMINAGEIPNYPIKEFFLDKPINKFDSFGSLMGDGYIEAAVDKVIYLLRNNEIGDILVFFPGKGDTSKGCILLHQKMEKLNKILDKKIYCSALTSTTDSETQKLLTDGTKFKESGIYTRKVIFATEVAESSMTFPGVDFVVDTGLVHDNVYYSEKNMTALEKKYVSKASHKQRKGRTGRLGPGNCYNLFTEKEYENDFKEFSTAPISTEDISVDLTRFLANNKLITHIDFPLSYDKKKYNGGFINHQSNGNLKPTGVELCQFLSTFIESPPIENIKCIINRLIALDAVSVENNIGHITNLGIAISMFNLLPEIGRMLISGYNYHCRDDIVNLAAIYELIDYRMDNIFEKFRPTSKEDSIRKMEKKNYEKVKTKWINSLGDTFSLIDIYNEFHSYKYDTIDRKTGVIIRNKKGDAKEWCRKNFIHCRTMENVKFNAQQIHFTFGKVINFFQKMNPGNKVYYIFTDLPPVISNNRNENIMHAILDGYYINLMKKNGNKYINCFPSIKTNAGLSMDSLYAKNKSPSKYAIYTQLKSILGKTSYSVISKVSPSLIKEIEESNKNKYVMDCWKNMPEEEKKDSKQQKGHKQQKKYTKKQ